MSNKSFTWNFSKSAIIEKTEKEIADYDGEIEALSSIERAYKKDGKPFQNWSKNFTSDKCKLYESNYHNNWIEVSYISGGKYRSMTLYPDNREAETIWAHIQDILNKKKQYRSEQSNLLNALNKPSSFESRFIGQLEEIQKVYNEMRKEDSPGHELYYALYDYLG